MSTIISTSYFINPISPERYSGGYKNGKKHGLWKHVEGQGYFNFNQDRLHGRVHAEGTRIKYAGKHVHKAKEICGTELLYFSFQNKKYGQEIVLINKIKHS